MNEVILYIVLGLFAISIIVGGISYQKGYIPMTKKWGLRKLEEIKTMKYDNYTKIGDKPNETSFCCILLSDAARRVRSRISEPGSESISKNIDNETMELISFCKKYGIPMDSESDRCDKFNTLADSYKIKYGITEEIHMIYNNNAFKVSKLPDSRIIIKNLTLVNDIRKKLDELKNVVDKLELEVTFRIMNINLSDNKEYTYLSKPIVNQ